MRIDVKLLAVLSGVLFFLLSLFSGSALLFLDRVVSIETERAAALEALNTRLRAELFDLQDAYRAVPDKLESDPAVLLTEWAEKTFTVERIAHEDRAALTARYEEIAQRRDLRLGHPVIEERPGGVSISFGVTEEGRYQSAARELFLPGARLAQVTAKAEEVATAAAAPDVMQRKIAALNLEIAENSLSAEQARAEMSTHIADIAAKATRADDTARLMRWLLIAAALCITLLATTALYIATRRLVTQPLARLAETARHLAEDRDVPVPHATRRDEIGWLAAALGRLRLANGERRRLERETQTREEALRLRSERIGSAAAHFSEAAAARFTALQEAGMQLHGMASRLTEQAQHATNHAGQAEEESRTSRTGAETIAAETGNLIDGVAGMDRQITVCRRRSADTVTQTDEAGREIESLGALSEEIGGIVTIIAGIAHQTNLLALNATIEAERAGTSGKGFAVVAREVKDLAFQTREATSSIEKQVLEVQGKVQTAVSLMSGIAAAIAAIDGELDTAASAVRAQDRAAGEIRTLMSRLTENALTLEMNMTGVRTNAETTGAEAENVEKAAGTLTEESLALQEAIEAFLGKVEAA